MPDPARCRFGHPITAAAENYGRTAETISNSLRVGISPETAEKILTPAFAAEFDERRINAVAAALADVEIEDAYNGWDAFILHALGRHYAYSDFVAI